MVVGAEGGEWGGCPRPCILQCSSHVTRLDPTEVAAAVARADAPREAARVHHQEEVEAVDHEDVGQDPRVLAQGGEALEVGEGDHLCSKGKCGKTG